MQSRCNPALTRKPDYSFAGNSLPADTLVYGVMLRDPCDHRVQHSG